MLSAGEERNLIDKIIMAQKTQDTMENDFDTQLFYDGTSKFIF